MRKLKGFTLVEILIVIVIIGILIGALVPRMQSAQGRARDVARKNDLSQLQSAIVTSYTDRGERPGLDDGCKLTESGGCTVSEISEKLIAAGLNGVPNDPIKSNYVTMVANNQKDSGSYGYGIGKKNGVADAGFILMAHTEVEGGSNWVDCGTGSDLSNGRLDPNANDFDLKNVNPCTKLTKSSSSTGCSVNPGNECFYTDPTQLRYILVY